MLSKAQAPLWVNSFQNTLLFSLGLSLASLEFTTLLHRETPDVRFCHSGFPDLNHYHHPHWLFGWGSK